VRAKLVVALVSCLITAAVVGGFAIAAIPNGNTINACRNKSTFVLRVIDKDLGQSCSSSETALSWSSWRWSGPFVGSSTYRVGDVVRYSGSSYLAKGPAAPPAGTLPTNTSYWALVVAKGDPGPAGPAGSSGSQYSEFEGLTANAAGRWVVEVGSVPPGWHMIALEAFVSGGSVDCYASPVNPSATLTRRWLGTYGPDANTREFRLMKSVATGPVTVECEALAGSTPQTMDGLVAVINLGAQAAGA